MKKKSFLSVLALTGAVLVGAVACGGNDNQEPLPPVDQPQEPVVEYEHQFKGKVTLDKVYDVELRCIKGTQDFELIVKEDIKTVKGTYSFTDGVGYEFKFNDANKTVINSEFNKDTKEHTIKYAIKAGELGNGEAVLTLKDETFVPTVEGGKLGFIKKAVFKGALQLGDKKFPFEIRFKADKTYILDFETEQIKLDKTGAYTFENNTFEIELDGQKHRSTYDLATNTYTFAFEFTGPQQKLPLVATYTHKHASMVGFSTEFGGIDLDVIFYSNKKVEFDISCRAAFPGANEVFDRTYDWTYKANNIEITDSKKAVIATATYDKAAKSYSMKYVLKGERDIPFDLTASENDIVIAGGLSGFVSKPFPCSFYLEFFKDGVAHVDVDTALGNGGMTEMFDVNNATYTFVNNVITLKVADKTFESTWDETTGTYTINYVMAGRDGNFEPVCTYTIWGN